MFSTTHESKTHPGVKFTVRVLSKGRQIAINQQLADANERLDALRIEAAPLRRNFASILEDAQVVRDPDETDAQFAIRRGQRALEAVREASYFPEFQSVNAIQRKIEQIESDEVFPAYIRALLVSVEGPDMPATPDDVIAEAPPALYAEIVAAVKKEMGLSPEESGNSASPSTSNARADGEMKITSAVVVENAATA